MPLQRNQLVDNFGIYIVIASSWLDVKYKKFKCLLHFLDTYWSGTRIHHVFLHTKEATSSERRRRKEKPASARTLTPLFPETQTHKLALHISKNVAMDQRSPARNSTLSQKVLYCLFYIEELMTTHEGEQGLQHCKFPQNLSASHLQTQGCSWVPWCCADQRGLAGWT